jgi:NAD-dependent dihydropyrimidine dehydrogenase PreA subunit
VFNPLIPKRRHIIKTADSLTIELEEDVLTPDRYATGDYFCVIPESSGQARRRITGNTNRKLMVSAGYPFDPPPSAGERIEIQIRLQIPYVDPQRCIGCGICEHECPVPGKRAIRVTADNESRAREHALLLRR